MLGTADNARAIIQLSWPGFSQIDQLSYGLDRQRRMDSQYVGLSRYKCHRPKVVHIVRRFLQHRENPDACPADKQSVAVRRRFGDRFRRLNSGTIINDYRLPQSAGNSLGNLARREIAAASRCQGDDAYRLARKILAARDCRHLRC